MSNNPYAAFQSDAYGSKKPEEQGYGGNQPSNPYSNTTNPPANSYPQQKAAPSNPYEQKKPEGTNPYANMTTPPMRNPAPGGQQGANMTSPPMNNPYGQNMTSPPMQPYQPPQGQGTNPYMQHQGNDYQDAAKKVQQGMYNHIQSQPMDASPRNNNPYGAPPQNNPYTQQAQNPYAPHQQQMGGPQGYQGNQAPNNMGGGINY